MNARVLIPHPSLQSYIQNYLYFEVGARNQWTRADTSPTGLPVMLFVMDTEQFSFKEFGSHEPLMFWGQVTKYSQMHGYGKMRMFYIFFHPVGAYQLFGIPLKDLKDQVVNLSDLMGATARILKEKLADQTTVAGMRQAVETFFLKNLTQQKKNEAVIRLTHAIDQIGRYCHQNNVIKEVCFRQGYSISTLERHMRDMAGLSPKMLQRIVRFKKVLRYLKQQHPPYRWAQIARQFGYYDQTHFIKDFVWFYGTTPGYLEALDSKIQLSLNSSGEEETGKSIFRVYE